MSNLVLQGPFLTRAQAAHRAGVSAELVSHRPDLLRVGGRWLQEAYFAFQFDEHGVRPNIGAVVQRMRGRSTDVDIATWLVRPNRELHGSTPLACLEGRNAVERVLGAAEHDGPVLRHRIPAAPPLSTSGPTPAPQHHLRRPRQHRRHRLAHQGR